VERGGLAVWSRVPEQLQGPELRRRREREEAHVRLRPPEQGCPECELVRGREVLALLFKLGGDGAVRQQLLDRDRHLAALGAVGLVDDEGVTAVGQRLDLVLDEAELVDGRDDDGGSALERRGELVGAFVDALDHAGLVLELVNRVLQLLVENRSVGQDHDRVVDLLVTFIVQARQPVGQPGDGIGLARARRVLDKEIGPGPARSGSSNQPPHAVQLMVPGEDEGLRRPGPASIGVHP